MVFLSHLTPTMNQFNISLTCFRRPDYLSEVIASLDKSLFYSKIDVSKITLYASIDGDNKEVVELINNIDFIPKNITQNIPNIGCNRNTFEAIDRAIIHSDYVLHLEDDTVLSEDAIEYFLYMFNKYKDNNRVICVGGYNKTDSLNINDLYTSFTENFFSCWGCGFWSHKWSIFQKGWTNQMAVMNPQSWDSYLQENLFASGQKYQQVRPIVSRVQNIGARLGTWVADPIWHEFNHKSPFTSNDVPQELKHSWTTHAKDNQ